MLQHNVPLLTRRNNNHALYDSIGRKEDRANIHMAKIKEKRSKIN